MKNLSYRKKIAILASIGCILLIFFSLIRFFDPKPKNEPATFEDYTVNASDVEMEIIPNGLINGPIYFDVETNLSAGKKLMLNLTDEDGFYYHEEITVLEDGIAHTSPITAGDKPLKGHYVVMITEPEHDEIKYAREEFSFI